jgi:hypothetical protein
MSKQIVPGNNAISIDPSGWVLFKRPHGTFYSVTTQAIADPAVNTQVIAFEKEIDNEGLTHSLVTNNSRIYVPTAGSYEIIFSGIASLALGSNKKIDIWLKVDGSTIAESNTICRLAGANEQTMVAAFVYDLNAGQYVELGTWGESTSCQWLATTGLTVPTRPDCPSVVMTVKKISSKLAYE